MNARDKRACKVFAADVRLALRAKANIGISALNYGLKASDDVVRELGRMLPGVIIATRDVMGYIHFERREP